MISPMSRAIHLISSLVFLSGCALFDTANEPAALDDFKGGAASQVFQASYDEVWRAAQKTLIKFPIILNNIDHGVIETEPQQFDLIWPRPYSVNNSRRLGKYTLNLNIIRGKINGEEATRVIIVKKVKVERDFFSEEKQLSSDGYEENIILYRIQREIVLERSIKRNFESKDS